MRSAGPAALAPHPSSVIRTPRPDISSAAEFRRYTGNFLLPGRTLCEAREVFPAPQTACRNSALGVELCQVCAKPSFRNQGLTCVFIARVLSGRNKPLSDSPTCFLTISVSSLGIIFQSSSGYSAIRWAARHKNAGQPGATTAGGNVLFAKIVGSERPRQVRSRPVAHIHDSFAGGHIGAPTPPGPGSWWSRSGGQPACWGRWWWSSWPPSSSARTEASSGSCGPERRRRWSAGWPTGSPSRPCSATRSGCRSPTPPSSPSGRTSSAPPSASFVQENLLTPALITDRVRHARIPTRVADWLADEEPRRPPGPLHRSTPPMTWPGSSRRTTSSGSSRKGSAGPSTGWTRPPWPPRRSRRHGLAGYHQEAFNAVLRGTARFLDEHRRDLQARFLAESPWWRPEAVDRKIFTSLVDGALRLLEEIAADPDHPLRDEVDVRSGGLPQARDVTGVAGPHRPGQGGAAGGQIPQLAAWLWRDIRAAPGRPGGGSRLGAAHPAGGGHRRRRPAAARRPRPPRPGRAAGRDGSPPTSPTTSTARSVPWSTPPSAGGTARRPPAASSCCSGPTCSSSASTAR